MISGLISQKLIDPHPSWPPAPGPSAANTCVTNTASASPPTTAPPSKGPAWSCCRSSRKSSRSRHAWNSRGTSPPGAGFVHHRRGAHRNAGPGPAAHRHCALHAHYAGPDRRRHPVDCLARSHRSAAAAGRGHPRRVRPTSVRGRRRLPRHGYALSGNGPAYVFCSWKQWWMRGASGLFAPRGRAAWCCKPSKARWITSSTRPTLPRRLRNQVTSPGWAPAPGALYYLRKAGFRTALSRAIWARLPALGAVGGGKAQPACRRRTLIES